MQLPLISLFLKWLQLIQLVMFINTYLFRGSTHLILIEIIILVIASMMIHTIERFKLHGPG